VGNRLFIHEALFYSGEDEFLAGVVPLVQGAVANDEPVLVAVDKVKIRAIKGSLNGEAEGVHFVDMQVLGVNPARIIPAWRDFVSERGAEDRPIRGVGEPIWAGRRPAELVECHQHESLLNLAFAQTQAFWLLCPYDSSTLAEDVLEEAQRTHPLIAEGAARRPSDDYLAPDQAPGPFAAPLPAPATTPAQLPFGLTGLREMRRFVSERATVAGLAPSRAEDLVLAASELATNSVLHAGGKGTVLTWSEDGTFFCEVRDRGPELDHPLAGRERPTAVQSSGRGLWLVNLLCDLVQIRSFPDGNAVRLHMSLDRSPSRI
jgi:anti-sigma regulatory factor (Ser/Thr protein kinase)